jgi:hypothetical protein
MRREGRKLRRLDHVGRALLPVRAEQRSASSRTHRRCSRAQSADCSALVTPCKNFKEGAPSVEGGQLWHVVQKVSLSES